MNNIEALRKAIRLLDGQSQLAKAIGKTQGHVSVWLARGKVPAEVCLGIETATAGEVTRYDLRPDVFGEPLADSAITVIRKHA